MEEDAVEVIAMPITPVVTVAVAMDVGVVEGEDSDQVNYEASDCHEEEFEETI